MPWPKTAAGGHRVIPYQFRTALATGVPPVAPPAANPGASTYLSQDLTGVTSARLAVIRGNAGVAGQMILMQYSKDGGANWLNLTDPFDIGGAGVNVLVTSPWSAIPADAQGDVLTRYAFYGGDGVGTITLFTCVMETR